jgi:hypothetical protein
MTRFLTLDFLQKNKIFLHANALWKYNSKQGVSNIIWPQYNIKNQNWYNNKKIILTKNHYNYRSQNKK